MTHYLKFRFQNKGKERKNKRNIMKTIRLLLSKKSHLIVLIFTLDIIALIINIYVNFKSAEVIKSLVKLNDFTLTFKLSITVLIFWYLYLFVENNRKNLQDFVISIMIVNYREFILDKISFQDFSEFSNIDRSEYLSWLSNDTNLMEQKTFRSFFDLSHYFIYILGSFFALSYISIWLSMSSVVFFALMVLFPAIFQKKSIDLTNDISKRNSDFIKISRSLLFGIDILDNYNLKSRLAQKIDTSSKDLEMHKLKSLRYQNLVNSLVQSLSLSIQYANQFIFVLLALYGKVSPELILTIGNLSGSFYNSLGQFSQLLPSFKSTKNILDKVKISQPVEKFGTNLTKFTDQIKVNRLNFSYSEKENLFDNLSLEIKAGQKIALIGKSGTGKSTFLRILLKRVGNFDGQISIDGVDIQDISTKSINNLITYINKDAYIFHDSIHENLTLGQKFSELEIMESIKQARLNTLVTSPADLDLDCGEDGSNLSSGEKQRVSIARAFLFGRKVVFFDEADNSIDKENAHEIRDLLLNKNGLTLIYVNHSLDKNEHIKFDKVITLGAN
jgi:ATP-binding cassette, subfamily B, bacterial